MWRGREWEKNDSSAQAIRKMELLFIEMIKTDRRSGFGLKLRSLDFGQFLSLKCLSDI